MERAEIRDLVLATLEDVAPEADASRLDAAAPIREQLDLDSIDFLRFVTRLHERLGVDVPEADYGELASIDGAVGYLAARTA